MDEESIAHYDQQLDTPAPHEDQVTLRPGFSGQLPPGLPDLGATQRMVIVGIAAVVAAISFFVLGPHFSDPAAYTTTIASLDAKRETVMSLVGASTASSAALTLLPGDLGTPLAEKLIDLSGDFMFVLTAIYLEKYLLTVLGFLAFKVLVPAGCACMALASGFWRSAVRNGILGIGAKLLLLGLAVVCVVPASVFVSGMIERTYESSITETVEAAQQTTDQIEAVAQDVNVQEGTTGEQVDFWQTIQSLPSTLSNSVTSTVTNLTQEAQKSVNNFIEALAVMIVTSCIIPVLVLLFFLWLVRTLLGVDISMPMMPGKPRSLSKRH